MSNKKCDSTCCPCMHVCGSIVNGKLVYCWDKVALNDIVVDDDARNTTIDMVLDSRMMTLMAM